jgi:two-component system, NarL family, nitrate/nitrite response regulator NarL
VVKLATPVISILLIDDHALFRESVTRLLNQETGLEVIAHCGSIEEGLEVLARSRVDIVLLDFDLGGAQGTEFVRAARQRGFLGKILVVTAGVSQGAAAQLIRNGISGIFMKNQSADLLAQGIHDVMAGKVWFDRELLQAAMASDDGPRAELSREDLTERQQHVLRLVFEGLANKEIAQRIGVSESSVKATLQQLFSKMAVHTRSQLVRVVLEQYPDRF